MAETPNIGLVKQAGTEYGDVEILNSNLDKIDEEIGKRGKTINGIQPDPNGNYQVSEVPFARQLVTDDQQQSSGEYLFRTTGGTSSLTDGDAKLVKIYGRSTHTGIVEESLLMNVSAVSRENPITATIDRDTFVAYVTTSGTITLSYTNAWSANPTLYGVTVTGTPVSGDQISIAYTKASRGLITNSAPEMFISTGWNLYDHSKTYAHVKKYSNSAEFIIGGNYTALQYSATLTGSKSTIVPVNGHFSIIADGYLWVTGGDDTTTYILMTWTDWNSGYEGDWQAYTESTVDFSSVAASAFPYGMMQVGGVSDEIQFGTAGKAISRIERLSYDENIASIKASGRAYDCDEDYIYAVRVTNVITDIEVPGDFTASDHGNEVISGGTVAPFVQTIYGENLVDKLRTDVLTKSPQTLTDSEKSQALNNIGGTKFIQFTSSDTTWELIWAKLDTLDSGGESATFSAPNTVMNIISNGARNHSACGIINRYSSTGFRITAQYGSAGGVFGAMVTGATSAGTGITYTEYNYATKINAFLNSKLITSSSATTHALVIPNSCRSIIAGISTSKAYSFAYIVTANSAGTVSVLELAKGEDVSSVATAKNSFTVTLNSTAALNLFIFANSDSVLDGIVPPSNT